VDAIVTDPPYDLTSGKKGGQGRAGNDHPLAGTEDKPMSEPMDPNMRVWGYTASELLRAINIAANYEPGWYAGVRFILPDIDPEDAALIVAAVNALPSLLDERELLRAALVEADRFLSLYWDDGGDAGDEEQLALAQGVIRDALAMVLRWQATVPEPVREYRTQKGMGL
jgi:hypothetical protein